MPSNVSWMNLKDGGRFRSCIIPQRRNMEQSDLYLLQNVPPYHLQALVKARHLPYSFKGQKSSVPPDSSATTTEIAQHLFDPISCRDAIRGLGEMEKSILGELV